MPSAEIIIDKSGPENAKPMPVAYLMRDGSFADGRTLADMFIAAFGMPEEQDNERT